MNSNYGSINPELLGLAKQNLKKAFVAAGDPAMDPMAGGGGAPMPGGAPPMDPMAAGGAPPMDPMAAGGAPPMDPAMMDPMAQLQPLIDQAVQAALAAQGGGGAAGGGAPKAKKFDPEEIDRRLFALDTNLAKIADALGVTLSPSDVVTPPAGETGPPTDAPQEAMPMDPAMAAGSAISPPAPISPMGAAVPKQAAWENGHADTRTSDEAIDGLEQTANVASAWLRMSSTEG